MLTTFNYFMGTSLQKLVTQEVGSLHSQIKGRKHQNWRTCEELVVKLIRLNSIYCLTVMLYHLSPVDK